MLWNRIILLFIFFLLGKHFGFPNSPRYIELADSADFFIARENWDRAEETILKALRLEPANFSNSLLLANLGLVQSNKGEYKKAIETLTLGLNIAPSSAVLLNNRAHTYLLLDDISSASRDIDKSLGIDSLQQWPLQTKAFIYIHENKTDSAITLLNKLKENFSDNYSVYKGFASIAENRGDYLEALKNYREAVKLAPDDDIELKETFIQLLIKTENYTEARAELRKAIDGYPENPMFFLLRGYLHKLNFRLDEAQADKKTAISKGIDPATASLYIP